MAIHSTAVNVFGGSNDNITGLTNPLVATLDADNNNISNVGSLSASSVVVNSAYTLPSSLGTKNQVLTVNDAASNVEWATNVNGLPIPTTVFDFRTITSYTTNSALNFNLGGAGTNYNGCTFDTHLGGTSPINGHFELGTLEFGGNFSFEVVARFNTNHRWQSILDFSDLIDYSPERASNGWVLYNVNAMYIRRWDFSNKIEFSTHYNQTRDMFYTSDDVTVDGEFFHLVVTNDVTAGKKIYINGVDRALSVFSNGDINLAVKNRTENRTSIDSLSSVGAPTGSETITYIKHYDYVLGASDVNSLYHHYLQYDNPSIPKISTLNTTTAILPNITEDASPDDLLFYDAVTGEITYGDKTTITSDLRLKHEIEDLEEGLKLIRDIKPKRYIKTRHMNASEEEIEKGKYQVGVIAQELMQLEDELVVGGDFIDPSDNIVRRPYSVKYNDLFVYNLKATQELDEYVSNLLTRIEKQEILVNKLVGDLILVNKKLHNIAKKGSHIFDGC